MQSQTNDKPSILQKIEQNFIKLSEQFQFVRDAVKFLSSILMEYPKTTFISFNGGKDATIALVLTYLAVKNLMKNHGEESIKMPEGIYFTEPNPFPEMDQFYNEMIKAFNLVVHTRPTQKIPQQMSELASSRKIDCVIMGSRKDDWCGDIGLRAPSDTHKGYPFFLRINPIMYWEYHQIWPVINTLEIPYCKLYKEGYTSLGNKSNSVKNQSLLVGKGMYKHAAEANGETQRDCRLKDEKMKLKGENVL